MVKSWVPDRGDLIWLDFDPQSGREQAGRRPALVLSPAAYNSRSGLAIAVPVTSRRKGYPFEVGLPEGLALQGAVLSDHLKSVDWRQRQAEFVERAPGDLLDEVQARIAPLLGLG